MLSGSVKVADGMEQKGKSQTHILDTKPLLMSVPHSPFNLALQNKFKAKFKKFKNFKMPVEEPNTVPFFERSFLELHGSNTYEARYPRLPFFFSFN